MPSAVAPPNDAPPGAKPLTRRQREVYEFVRAEIDRRGVAPSIREIAEDLGVSSTNAAAGHLKALQRKGRIKLLEKTSRGIVLTRRPAAKVRPCTCPNCGHRFEGGER